MDKAKGFTLVELLISMVLGIILLSALAGFLSSLVKSYQVIQSSQNLYDEASVITQLWQHDFASVGDLGCQIFQNEGQIKNHSKIPLLTEGGIKVYRVGRDTLPNAFPKNTVKKLLPGSMVILEEHILPPFYQATYDPEKQGLIINHGSFQKNDLILLSQCQVAWLFNADQISSQKNTQFLKLPFSVDGLGEDFQVAKWQSTFWFAMQNLTKEYGMYRLIFSEETTPVEFVSHVTSFQIQALMPGWHFEEAQASLAWQEVQLIRVKLNFSEHDQTLNWPMSFVFTRKAFGWRQV